MDRGPSVLLYVSVPTVCPFSGGILVCSEPTYFAVSPCVLLVSDEIKDNTKLYVPKSG